MQKKRLEDALNASKLFDLGFNLNFGRPESLNLLYYVDSSRKNPIYSESIQSKLSYKNQKSKTMSRNAVDKDDDEDSNESDSDVEINTLNKSKSSKGDDEFEEKNEILCLQFNQNLNLLATGDSNGTIQIYDIFSGLALKAPVDANNSPRNRATSLNSLIPKSETYSNSLVHNMPAICLKWYPYSNYSTSLLYFAHVNGYIGIFDKQTMKKTLIIEEPDEISCIDFCRDGSCFASVGKDYTIKLYDSNLNNSTSFNKLLKSYGCFVSSDSPTTMSNSPNDTINSHSNRLQSVKFSNVSNDILFTGGWDRTVKIWDKRTQTGLVNTIHGPFICGSDAIDINNHLILTAAWVKDNALSLWDMRNTKKKLQTLPIKKNTREDLKGGEYLYACKFFSSTQFNLNEEKSEKRASKHSSKENYSTVLACGSGTQSLHLMDYDEPSNKQHLDSFDCKSPLYCLDAIYSCSLIACGGMNKYFSLMATSRSD